MSNTKVSILIPFKDTELYLPECLDSVLAQTHNDWEVIAIDDGSSDNSPALMQHYAAKDERIQPYKNRGQGIIPALQMAYTKAAGNFVTRMDSDDIMVPERLEWMLNALHSHGKGHVAVGQVRYFSHRGISNGYERYETWLNSLTAEGKNYDEIYKECVIPSPCWMVHRTDFDISNAFNPNRYPEDYDLTFRFYANGLKVIPCDKVLHHWRDYDTRTSRTHEHYAQNYFLDIKLHYFLKLDYRPKRPLVVWGAGYKGKTIAKRLLEMQINFVWLCDNPLKIGKKIYGKELVHFKTLKNLNHPQSIVTVANEAAQRDIKHFFSKVKQVPMHDYFFFC
ncbi:glycosyltransferase family 2 protein [Flagellimonas flava]|uniref:Glycosyltransferase involved in cell wall bisynthesis n=1 Tax=Flagellimonas flava TaxID=570519 RepID=A0A1M5IZH0_9FLAO|nr:glycosyltransferase family 2 protein [Allomuricauda flava]SHG33727.1 Glycosyltransferase involved in cell wall bisynthesis [Allomuricauda flava]